MKSISIYAHLVKIVSIISIPMLLIAFVMTWLVNDPMISDPSFFRLSLAYTFDEPYEIFFKNIRSMSLLWRLLAMCVDALPLFLLVFALYKIITLMNGFIRGECFSSTIVTAFAIISKAMMVRALCLPLTRMLVHFLMTLHKGPGQREISIGFGSCDMINILIFGFLMVIAMVICEGYRLQHEHDLTV